MKETTEPEYYFDSNVHSNNLEMPSSPVRGNNALHGVRVSMDRAFPLPGNTPRGQDPFPFISCE